MGEEFPLACPGCGGDIRLIAFRLFYQCETIPGLRTVGNLRLRRTSCPRARADPEDPDTLGRTARAAAARAGSGPAGRLGRDRPGSWRSRRLSAVTQRAPGVVGHPQEMSRHQKPPAEAGGMTRGDQRRRERKRTASPFRRFLGILICMAVSVRQLVRLLEDDGWVEVRQRGSHRQFRHPTKSGAVTVAGKESADVPPGTLNSVLKQAGLKNQR